MSRKDYIRAVKTIQATHTNEREYQMMIDIFVEFFKGDNLMFDENKFRKACKAQIGGYDKNSVKCNRCGDILESRSVHDFVTCKCGAVSIDGGSEYLKRVGNEEDYTEMSHCCDL